MNLLDYLIAESDDALSNYAIKYYGYIPEKFYLPFPKAHSIEPYIPRLRGLRVMRYATKHKVPALIQALHFVTHPWQCYPSNIEDWWFTVKQVYKDAKVYNKHCGEDVIKIHTRCGWYRDKYKQNKNYNFAHYECDRWFDQLDFPYLRKEAYDALKENNLLKPDFKLPPQESDLFKDHHIVLDCVLDPFDSTYMTVYVKAYKTKEYDKVIKTYQDACKQAKKTKEQTDKENK